MSDLPSSKFKSGFRILNLIYCIFSASGPRVLKPTRAHNRFYASVVTNPLSQRGRRNGLFKIASLPRMSLLDHEELSRPSKPGYGTCFSVSRPSGLVAVARTAVEIVPKSPWIILGVAYSNPHATVTRKADTNHLCKLYLRSFMVCSTVSWRFTPVLVTCFKTHMCPPSAPLYASISLVTLRRNKELRCTRGWLLYHYH